MSEILLQIKDVSIGYGQVEAVKHVSLQADSGITALLGANGAGKTSLLKAISGLIPVISGEVRFCDVPIHRLPAHKIVEKGLVHVPEGRRIFADMTVEENLLLGAYSVGERKKFFSDLQEIYHRFPRLRERKNQPGGTLSGGEQQMLALGRGLMSHPKMLLLDEPTMGLSPLMIQEIGETIRGLKESGIAILLVEQNAGLALSLADRGYVLVNGRIRLAGDAEKLKQDPAVVRAYLGT